MPRQLVAAAPYLRAHDFITSPSPHPQVLLVPLSELCFVTAVPVTSCSLLCICGTNTIISYAELPQ